MLLLTRISLYPSDNMSSQEPRDMSVMRSILKEMGVSDHEPAVLHQLMEFTYKYITGVLEDAKLYSEHASKDEVE